ncbi:MAG: efflux RND transporter periplasmic adaptor subunit, partial [Kofleriaceae bacterium]
QVLAEIDTPELAAELSQARAQLLSARAAVKQATAQRDYSRSNSTRYTTLADQQLVSKSQVEETAARAATDEATVAAAESNVTAMEANVRRLVELQGFAKVVAPFAGTITTRSVDRGALVQAGGTTPMFTLVATDPVRIFVDVPQTIAPSVRADTPATVTVREYAGRTFTGKVTRSAGALDEEMHTMTTEIQVPNTDGALLPGMYVQVSITLPTPHKVLEIPSTALYSDADGLRVATVDAQQRVKFAKITVERDTGATLQISTGLTGDEQIIKIAVPGLRDGDAVIVAPPPSASPAGSGSAK